MPRRPSARASLVPLLLLALSAFALPWLAAGGVEASPAAAVAADVVAQPAPPATPTAGPVVEVAVVDDAFEPAVVTVTVGSTVRWANRGQRLHSVTSDQGYFNWTLQPGTALRVRFLSAGSFGYHCVYHAGMTGRVIVVPGPTAPTATASATPDGSPTSGPSPTPTGTGPVASPTPTAGATWPAPGPVGPPVGPAAGGAIVFQDVGGGGRTDLFVIAADGAGRRALTTTAARSEAQPHWSPDRRAVAYAATGGSGATAQWRIEIVDAQSGAVRPVTAGPSHFEPRWRPDGQWIAFTAVTYASGAGGTQLAASAIGVVRPDGSGARIVLQATGSSHVIGNPSWSPDGRTLAFVRRSVGPAGADGELWALDLTTSTVRRLFAHPGWDDIQPAWSPDGRRIAFASHAASPTARPYAIWLLDLDTGQAGTVAHHPEWSLLRPSWSPGGGWIIFTAEIAAQPTRDVRLYYVEDGGGTVYGPLTTGAEPDWAGVTSFEPPTPGPGVTGTPAGPTPSPGPGTGTPPWPPTATPSATYPPPPLTPLPLPTPPSETPVPGPPPTFPAPTATVGATATEMPSATGTATPDLPPPSATPASESTPTRIAGWYQVWLPVAVLFP